MIKKFLLFFITLLIISCGSNSSTVRNSKPGYRKPSTSVASRTKRPTNRKPVSSKKPVTQRTASSKKEIEEEYEAAKEINKSNSKESVYSKEEILEATTRVKVTTSMVNDYISDFKGIAQNNMSQYGIPASIIIGQGILESGAGTGPLSMLANNHFGIKCHKEWSGPSVRYDDDEAQECFRQYNNPAESYTDHSLFLTSRVRYAGLFLLDKDDYQSWARGLKAAGYATDPKYPAKLISIIERYQLQQYDAEVLGKEFVPKSKPAPSVVRTGARENMISNSDLYQVTQGDTLYSISKKFNISVDELRRKNDIQDNAISIGQNLKVN